MTANGSRSFSLRPTTRARVVLVMLPLVFPLNVAWLLVRAFSAAGAAWWESFSFEFKETVRTWYRTVYRPARYGSVWDDLDANGYPTAWGPRRGSGPSE